MKNPYLYVILIKKCGKQDFSGEDSGMQIEQDRIKLVPMTEEMYRSFFLEFENDPDVCLPGQKFVHYE